MNSLEVHRLDDEIGTPARPDNGSSPAVRLTLLKRFYNWLLTRSLRRPTSHSTTGPIVNGEASMKETATEPRVDQADNYTVLDHELKPLDMTLLEKAHKWLSARLSLPKYASYDDWLEDQW
jgi:hypothetical protein